MQATSIEWTDYSANPFKFRDAEGKIVWGCVKHSAGCANCYSETLAKRYGRGGPFTKETMRGLTPFVDEKELRSMLTYKSARDKMCFVGDMTDVFGEWVTDDMLDKLFAVFAFRQDVTWQVLTKRPERMADYLLSFRNRKSMDRIDAAARTLGCAVQFTALDGRVLLNHDWPLKNVHLGTSVENQAAADERIPRLLRVPAAVRFLSCEPLLEKVYLRKAVSAFASGPIPEWDGCEARMTVLHWVIVGSESGPRRRPMEQAWAESLVGQCKSAGVACFVKQMEVGGKVTGDIEAFPESLRVREFPTVKAEVPA